MKDKSEVSQTTITRQHCSICKRLLDEPFEPLSRNCGGDCLECMAEFAEDPDCIEAVKKLKEQR